MKAKSQVPKNVDYYLTLHKSQGHTVKCIRCDNVGEHQKKLKEVCMKHNVTLEHTAANAPQTNGPVERRFAADGGRALAMMFAVGLNDKTQQTLWAEATSTASKIGNVVANRNSPMPPYTQIHQAPSKICNQLLQFGRIAHVAK